MKKRQFLNTKTGVIPNAENNFTFGISLKLFLRSLGMEELKFAALKCRDSWVQPLTRMISPQALSFRPSGGTKFKFRLLVLELEKLRIENQRIRKAEFILGLKS